MAAEPQNRKQMLFRNGVYSTLSWFLPLILALVVTPIIVKGLGNEMYGLYAVILGFISYSFTFGIGKTAAKYVAEYRSTGQTEKISETVSAILWISVTFGLAAIAIISLSARYIVVNVLLISPDLQNTAVLALYLASGTILFIMLSQVFQFVLQGVHRFDRYLLLTNLSGLLLNLGSVAIVLGGRGVLELLIWNLFVVVVVGFLFYINARRLLPEFNFRVTIKSEFWRPALKYSLSIVTYQVFGNLLLLFERAWIVRKFGTETLTFYVVPMTLCFYFHAFIGSLITVIFPVVNELLTDRDRLVRLYRTATKIVLTLTAFFVISSIVSGRIFLGVWMNNQFAELSYAILVVHTFTFAILATMTISWQMTESFRAAGLNAIVSVLWMIISIPLMISFADLWQSFGVAFARLLGVIVYLPLILYVETKFLGVISLKFWPATLLKLSVAAACAGLAEWLILHQMPPAWLTIGLAGIAGLLCYFITLFVVGFFEKEEKDGVKSLLIRFRRA